MQKCLSSYRPSARTARTQYARTRERKKVHFGTAKNKKTSSKCVQRPIAKSVGSDTQLQCDDKASACKALCTERRGDFKQELRQKAFNRFRVAWEPQMRNLVLRIFSCICTRLLFVFNPDLRCSLSTRVHMNAHTTLGWLQHRIPPHRTFRRGETAAEVRSDRKC